MENNKVSVCVTYYNQAPFVRQSLDSVLAIDFPGDFEILCGDDGSTDNTVSIIEEYVKKYPKHVKCFTTARDHNSVKSINRASANRLNLASHATGRYILFLDGDDHYCSTTFLRQAVTRLQTNPQLAACAFHFKQVYENKTEQIFDQPMRPGIVTTKKYITKGYYTHAGAVVFRNSLDKTKLKLLKQINNFDDNALTLYMLQFGDLYYINQPVYVYRQTTDSLWNNTTNTEQDLLNALDYQLISLTAPRLKYAVAKRQFRAMRHIYRNRKNLRELLGKKYESYCTKALTNCDYFIANLLQYNQLSLWKKLQTRLMWLNYLLNVSAYFIK